MSAKPLIGIQVRKLAEQNEYRLNPLACGWAGILF